MAVITNQAMASNPHTFKANASQWRVVVLAVSLGVLIPVYGFAQGPSDRTKALVEELKSPDASVRQRAVNGASTVAEEAKDVVPLLLSLLKNDTDQFVRRNAANQLREIGAAAKDTAPFLIEVLEKDPSPTVRMAVAQTLGFIGAENKDVLPALLRTLKYDAASGVRGQTAYALVQIGAEAKVAVPALIETLEGADLKDQDRTLRFYVTEALGYFGAEAEGAVPVLSQLLKNDPEYPVRTVAARALAGIGAEAKDAVPTLTEVLKNDSEHTVRSNAAITLGEIGREASAAVPALITALQDDKPDVRSEAAKALGKLGAGAKYILPALIDALKDGNKGVRSDAADTLVIFSKGLFDTKDTDMLPMLKEAYDLLKGRSERESRKQAADIKRTIDYLESLWWVGLREKMWHWTTHHSYISAPAAAWLFLLLLWCLMFWLRPLWLLPVSAFFGRYEGKIKWPVEMGVPLRHLLLVSLFHYRKRVLDKWVRKYLATARENFANKETVKQRKAYVSSPAMMDAQICDSISPAQAQTVFNKAKSTLLITAEGGAGKTSLACQMAAWAMEDKPEKRLCKSQAMLPVLIENNLEPQAKDKNAFTETIRGHLSDLIGTPEAVPEELLLQLLRQRCVLVIVDSLSELDDATRSSVKPAQTDFPVAALIVTSRTEDGLGGATKTIIKPLRLKSDRLSSFVDRYLEQRGKRELFTDPEFFESCLNLSRIIGNRDITALIAKMYAEQMIASKEQSSNDDAPRNLPDLMVAYVRIINENVQADKQNTRAVLRLIKAVAWECLKKTFRPASAKRDDVLKALKKEPDADATLEYLEKRLQLIQTAGMGKDAIRFSLDPLAEYLASLYVIEHYGNSIARWQEILNQMTAQPGAPETIKGFLLALLDCCQHHGAEHGVSASTITAISQILNPAPEAIV